MKPLNKKVIITGLTLTGLCITSLQASRVKRPFPSSSLTIAQATTTPTKKIEFSEQVLDTGLEKGLNWLIEAQHQDGSWGAGSHNHQSNHDPHNVKPDPATTAFAALALIRNGQTPYSGDYHHSLNKATLYMLDLVESGQKGDDKLSKIHGTQPQSKLGKNIDISMLTQYFSRLLPLLKDDDQVRVRVDHALETLLDKIKTTQNNDGSSKGAGWAGVLQSSISSRALDMASKVGKKVEREELDKSLDYNRQQFDAKTKKSRTEAAAGIELYSYSSSQLANAIGVNEAREILAEAKEQGLVDQEATISEDALMEAGVDKDRASKLALSYQNLNAQEERLFDEQLLNGFGNNGGEEFLSYLQTGESLIIAQSEKWEEWRTSMYGRLLAVQNPNGSWSGHHCITSPVFCTAASLLCLSLEHDADYLRQKDSVASK